MVGGDGVLRGGCEEGGACKYADTVEDFRRPPGGSGDEGGVLYAQGVGHSEGGRGEGRVGGRRRTILVVLKILRGFTQRCVPPAGGDGGEGEGVDARGAGRAEEGKGGERVGRVSCVVVELLVPGRVVGGG